MDKLIKKKIKALFDVIINEAEKNEDFAMSLVNIFDKEFTGDTLSGVLRVNNKRDKAVIDPIKLAEGGKLSMDILETLSEKELKDIIADYGMDNAKLAMKWKDKERLKTLICETSYRRANKGSAFRS